MRKREISIGFRWLPLLLFLGCLPRVVQGPKEKRLNELHRRISEILQDSLLRPATVGIFAVTEDGETLLDINSSKLFVPASNEKLLLTSALLHHLGPSFSFETVVFQDTLSNLYLKGGGDPILETQDLFEIAIRIKEKVKTSRETLFVCEDYQDTVRFQPGWTYYTAGSLYAPPLGGLSSNRNLLRVVVEPGESEGAPLRLKTYPGPLRYPQFVVRGRTSKRESSWVNVARDRKGFFVVQGEIPPRGGPRDVVFSVDEPSLLTGSIFSWCLSSTGVKIRGPLLKRCPPPQAETLFVHPSPPLSVILEAMNKKSDNFIAEMLLKNLGGEVFGAPGTREKGISAILLYLSEIGIDTLSLRAVEGSGLSRYNLLSPRHLVRVLSDVVSRWEILPEFFGSLPISGVDGTLKDRLEKLEGRVRAKTGTLWGVSSLSGVGITEGGRKVIFSILINNFLGTNREIRDLQDEVVDALLSY